MNETIKQLLGLQERDLQLDRLEAELSAIPKTIGGLKARIQEAKTALENAKKESQQLQVLRKQKDVDLETREGEVRKHSTELNSVKSNDAYKALLGEIEKAKQEKSKLEDEILQLMDQIDQAGKVWKEKEVAFKGVESDLLRQISDLETKQKNLEQEKAAKSGERDQTFTGLDKKLSEPYERLRKNTKGAAVVPLRNEQCAGCHMKISQNLINEVRRGQKMMFCEHCSRIVYLEEVPAAETKS